MAIIEEIDTNFKVDTKPEKENIRFYDCLHEPFEIFGVLKPTEKHPYFKRIDPSIAEKVSDNVATLNKHTAGGRVRFQTDSEYVAIIARMHEIGKMSHFALTGSAGFDLYEKKDGKESYIGTFIPPFDIIDGYESIITFEDAKKRELTIHFPLYSGVKELYRCNFGKMHSLSVSVPHRLLRLLHHTGRMCLQTGQFLSSHDCKKI